MWGQWPVSLAIYPKQYWHGYFTPMVTCGTPLSTLQRDLFVSVEFIDDPVSLAIGSIADFTMAAFLGFIMNLMLKKYGNDFAVLKGMGFGTFLYIILYGAFMDLNITRASLLTPLPNLLLFFPHILYGGVTCWLIRRYSVFLIQARGE